MESPGNRRAAATGSPPALDGETRVKDYNEIKEVGAKESEARTSEQIAMDDAIIAVFDGTYAYNFWHPVTAIRNGDLDKSDATAPDPDRTPFIEAPLHPEYPRAHCIVSGSLGGLIEAERNGKPTPTPSTSSPTADGAARSVIETPRLFLRGFTLADVDALFEVFADPDARRFYPEMEDRSAVERWIQKNLLRYEEDGFGLWAMIEKESGRLIGDCGLSYQDVEGVSELELGYHVLAAERRKGYATEAARACLDHGFRSTAAAVIGSIVSPANEASRAVAARVHANVREFMRPDGMKLFYFTRRPEREGGS